MSASRCQQYTPISKTRENGSVKSRCQNRKLFPPGLLRLDSTGEVTSANHGSNCQNQSVQNDLINQSETSNCRTKHYRNLVDTTMGALFNSASACFCSAKSYFGSLNPYNSVSKGLVRSKSESSTLGYLQTMLESKKQSDMEHLSVPGVNLDCKKCGKTKLNADMNLSSKWTDNIFGAIQSSLLNNCQIKSDKMRNVEKYVPPQRRCAQRDTDISSSHIDPKLTPYNARLLEKSRRSQQPTHSNVKKCDTGRKCADPDPVKLQVEERRSDRKECRSPSVVQESSETDSSLPIDSPQNNEVTSTLEMESNEIAPEISEPDWFEYQCNSAKCIPIHLEKVQGSPQQEVNKNDSNTVSNSKINQIHSWFSIENVSSFDCEEEKDETRQMMKTEKSMEEETQTTKHDRYKVIIHKPQNYKQNSTDEGSTAQTSAKSGFANSDGISDPIPVLCIRKIGKKQTRSAKKRRRRKSPSDSNEIASNCVKSSSDTKSNNVNKPTSAVAFILGYDNKNSDNSLSSFQVSCDMDSLSDSDWTESDCESDENFSSLEEENLFGNELGFQCNDLLRNMQFKLTCKMEPNESSTESSNASAIDLINMSWKVQVSIEPESKKKKSSKMVHFAEDLTTVHPIVAWSHAYQAARKGPWEQYARDRGRFQRRISETQKVLTPILDNNLRDRIYRERFSDN